jgi:hypothetical protein
MTTLYDLKERLTAQQQMAVHLLVANEFAGKDKKRKTNLPRKSVSAVNGCITGALRIWTLSVIKRR